MRALAPTRRAIALERPLDLVRSVAPMWRGGGDPTMRIANDEVARATRTPHGPATFHAVRRVDRIEVEAWGPGADWALELAPRALGCCDDDSGFRPRDPLIARLRAPFAGVHVTRTERLLEALLPVILEQKVTGIEARRAWARMARAFGETAPGPFDLLLPPDPPRVAASPYEVFHPFGVERRRAELLRILATRAARIEALVSQPAVEVRASLERLPGIGAWTTAKIAGIALGDPDAVTVGDYHDKDMVSWALAGEPRGTDERMLELLEPYRGHRGRVLRLLELGGPTPPKFGPRMAPRWIERL